MVRPHVHQRGTSLAEALVVMMIMGTVLTTGVPRLGVAFEGARADEAATVLRGLWNAERMHWIEYQTYTTDIDALISDKLIDEAVKTATEPFTFTITDADTETFTVEGERTGSDVWTGTLSVDEAGVISGQIEDGSGGVVIPYQD